MDTECEDNKLTHQSPDDVGHDRKKNSDRDGVVIFHERKYHTSNSPYHIKKPDYKSAYHNPKRQKILDFIHFFLLFIVFGNQTLHYNIILIISQGFKK